MIEINKEQIHFAFDSVIDPVAWEIYMQCRETEKPLFVLWR